MSRATLAPERRPGAPTDALRGTPDGVGQAPSAGSDPRGAPVGTPRRGRRAAAPGSTRRPRGALLFGAVGFGALLLAPLGCEVDSDALFPQRGERAWVVVWEDDFDAPAGVGVDPTRWTHDLGRGDNGWGNAELQTYTDRPANVAHTGDGHLAITAIRESHGGADYTSARIKTQGLFTTTYGRVEARLKLPSGAGLWPAFWMLGENIATVGWPACGEIDIMEYRGQAPDIVHGSLHGPGYFAGSPLTGAFFLPPGQRFDEDFHVFAVEWDPGRVAFYVDDQLYHLATSAQVPAGGRWVFDRPFFLILNVAVGGTFVGPPNEATTFPQTMLVDYVRVLARVP